MTTPGPAVLLLTSPLAPPDGRRALQQALAGLGPLTAPGWRVDPTASDLLEGPADQVQTALARTTGRVVLCGVGGGALLGLRVAAAAGERVTGLVLATGRPPSGPRLVRSLHRAVADLLPLAALQRLHAPERLLLQTLDLVRPQDVRALAARAPQPARVAWGRRDPLDRVGATRLAAALPAGTLVPLAGARPGWVWAEPQRLATLVAAVAAGR